MSTDYPTAPAFVSSQWHWMGSAMQLDMVPTFLICEILPEVDQLGLPFLH